MPPDLAVQVAGLGKKYRIGALQDRSRMLVEVLSEATLWPVRAARSLLGRQRTRSELTTSIIWALRDVSFEVERGEVMGIIGPNGAGKSTLLKVLTRITHPDEGYARIRGRVGSLLEVGTGFHAELTGRENIYLNGAILGMHRHEIDRKFDEIVAFSGVERFIDTPVKRYSSGMYLRLAFSVAAHLETDILLVDEVLAVGDAEFQKKCLGKMSRVAHEGRTVLFVGHNMAAVQHLCQSAIWLERGRVRQHGPVEDVIRAYLSALDAESPDTRFPLMNPQYGVGFADCQVHLVGGSNGEARTLRVELGVLAEQDTPRIGIGLGLITETGAVVTTLDAKITNFIFDMQKGVNRFVLEVPEIERYLAAGEYMVQVWLTLPELTRLIELDRAGLILLHGRDMFGTGRVPEVHRHGPLILPLEVRRAERAAH